MKRTLSMSLQVLFNRHCERICHCGEPKLRAEGVAAEGRGNLIACRNGDRLLRRLRAPRNDE